MRSRSRMRLRRTGPESRSGCTARNAQAIDTLLVQVEEALRADDLDKAAVPLGQIDKRLADGGADYLAARIDRARADIAMLQSLDDVNDIIWSAPERMRDQADAA